MACRKRREGTQALGGTEKPSFTGTPLVFTDAQASLPAQRLVPIVTAEEARLESRGVPVTMARDANARRPGRTPSGYPPILSARHRPEVSKVQRSWKRLISRNAKGTRLPGYLCGRPLRNRGRCTLGRETAIQKCLGEATAGTDDGWTGTSCIETPQPTFPMCLSGGAGSFTWRFHLESVERGQPPPGRRAAGAQPGSMPM